MALEAELVLPRDDDSPLVRCMGVVASQALSPLERIVARAAGSRFHQIRVAIGAERGAGFPEELLFVRPVRDVASSAIPDENRPMDIFPDEIRFRIGVAAITDLIRPVLQDRPQIRPMRVMAGSAVSFGKRVVLDFRFLRRLYLCMAGKAELAARRWEKPLVLCRMGPVTGEAPLPFRNRVMGLRYRLAHFAVALQADAVSFPCEQGRILRCVRIVAGQARPLPEGIVQDRAARLHLGFVVALVTERAPLSRRRERLLGGRRWVACIAPFFHYGVVCACLQKLRLGRGMRIVAHRASGRLHGVIPVRFFEGSFAGIVA